MPRLLALAVVLASPALAQSAEPLVTDRPDFTESAASVGWGRVQVEGGGLAARADGRMEASGPEALVRVGLGRGAELRVGLPEVRVAGGEAAWGAGVVGAKLELGARAGWAAALIAEVPAESRPSPLAILTVGRDVGGRLSVGAQAEALWDRVGGRLVPSATAVVSRALSGRSGVFGEVAAAGGGPLGVTLHGGATHRLSPGAQVDVRAGVGVLGPSGGPFVGVGGAVRL